LSIPVNLALNSPVSWVYQVLMLELPLFSHLQQVQAPLSLLAVTLLYRSIKFNQHPKLLKIE